MHCTVTLSLLPPQIYVKPAIPDVGAGVAMAPAPHADLQAVPPGKINRNGHILRGGGHHDDVGAADAGLVVDRPEGLEPRAAAGNHLAQHQRVQQGHRGLIER